MGQFLCIGIRTAVIVKRKNLQKPFMAPEEVVAELERQLAPAYLYHKFETEDRLVYRLRPEAVQDEFIPFLKEFYRLRYAQIGEKDMGGDSYIRTISEYDNLGDWIELAKKKKLECFQISEDHDNIKISDLCYLNYYQESIILSMNGKILMECYKYLFLFLLQCIKSRLSEFKLKNTLSIFITD